MKKKILSLDGGDRWVLIQVKCLQNLFGYNATGYDILQNFDIAIVNSDTSLVLAALCNNYTLSEIADVFLHEKLRKFFFAYPSFFSNEKFYNAWLSDDIPNQPIRLNGQLKCLIGHQLFSNAKRGWQDCTNVS